MVGGREMRDLEVRAPESSDAPGYPRDLLADDRAGRVQGLRKQSYGLGRAPVFAGDVTATVLAPARLGLDRPVDLEPVLPPLQQSDPSIARGQVDASGYAG